MTDRARAWLPWIAPLIALAVGLAAGPQPLDDAFITLRYARSLAAGDGFVFNPGEHVLGTTTPLFALVLAAAHWVTAIDLVWLAFGLSLAAHIAVTALITSVGNRCEFPHVGALAACLYALAPLAVQPMLGCMETSLFVGAALYTLAPGERRATAWRSVAAAAAMLLRPEGVLAAGLHLFDTARVDRRALVRSVLIIDAATLPWLLFATWYFGNPLPQSMRAKWSYQASLPPGLALEHFWFLLLSVPFAAPLLPLAAFPAQPFGTLIAQHVPLPLSLETRRIAVLVLGTAILALAATGAVALYRRSRGIGWWLVFSLAYVAAYCIARPQIFAWYLVPPLPVLLLACLTGATVIARKLVPDAAAYQLLVRVAALGLVGIAAWQCGRVIVAFPSPREAAYREAVRMIGAPAQDPATVIGAVEIGAIGYYSRARVVDHLGLISPNVLRLGIAGTIERERPDFYIAQEGLLDFLGFLRAPAFTEQYTPIARLTSNRPDVSPTLLYRRTGPLHD